MYFFMFNLYLLLCVSIIFSNKEIILPKIITAPAIPLIISSTYCIHQALQTKSINKKIKQEEDLRKNFKDYRKNIQEQWDNFEGSIEETCVFKLNLLQKYYNKNRIFLDEKVRDAIENVITKFEIDTKEKSKKTQEKQDDYTQILMFSVRNDDTIKQYTPDELEHFQNLQCNLESLERTFQTLNEFLKQTKNKKTIHYLSYWSLAPLCIITLLAAFPFLLTLCGYHVLYKNRKFLITKNKTYFNKEIIIPKLITQHELYTSLGCFLLLYATYRGVKTIKDNKDITEHNNEIHKILEKEKENQTLWKNLCDEEEAKKIQIKKRFDTYQIIFRKYKNDTLEITEKKYDFPSLNLLCCMLSPLNQNNNYAMFQKITEEDLDFYNLLLSVTLKHEMNNQFLAIKNQSKSVKLGLYSSIFFLPFLFQKLGISIKIAD